MQITIKLILSLFLLLFTQGIQGREMRFLDSIHAQINNGKETGSILLSDGLECLWEPLEDERLMLSHWKQGDKISITQNDFNAGVALINESSTIYYYPQVLLSSESIESLPRILKIDTFLDETYTYITVFHQHIILSDGSIWLNKYYEGETKNWKKGDPILIDPYEDSPDFFNKAILINYRICTHSDHPRASVFCEETTR